MSDLGFERLDSWVLQDSLRSQISEASLDNLTRD
jgi:hypothetical protein